MNKIIVKYSEYLKSIGFLNVLFLFTYILSGYYFGLPGIIIFTIIGMFINTSSTNNNGNQLSAYGILNPGFQRIMGDLRLDQLERQLFNRYIEEDNDNDSNVNDKCNEKYSDDEMNYPISKYSNKKCPKCNSGRKYKKCCAILLKN